MRWFWTFMVLVVALGMRVFFGTAADNSGAESSAEPSAQPGYGAGVAQDQRPITSSYGPAPQQFATLTVPATADASVPVVVLVHGGFWRARYGLDLMEPLAADLVARGYATWNIEYRRVGEAGGGGPGTLTDVAAAIDHLATLADENRLDLDRVAVVGHSAGGHLALWSGSRHLLGPGQPGADPVVAPRRVIGLAAVADLAAAADENLGDGATQDFLGGEPNEVPAAYALAQPTLDARTAALVHGAADTIVPLSQSERFAAQGIEVVVVPDEDHFSVIDPSSRSWASTLRLLTDL